MLLILLLIGITVAFLPAILSSDWVKNIAVSRVNSSSSGELFLGNCEIGWSEGLQCATVAYQDTAQGYQFTAARLKSTQGLFSLITAPKNLGTITVDDPVLVLPQHPEKSDKSGASSQDTDQSAGKTEQTEPAVTDTSAAGKGKWFWHKMAVKLVLNRLAVQLKAPDTPVPLLSQGKLDAELVNDSLKFTLSLATGADGNRGAIKSEGQIDLPSVKGNLLDQMTADMLLTLTDVQTGPFLALAPADSGVPRGQGMVSAELTVKNTESGNLVVRGPITLTDIDLTGGFLQEDHPRVEQLALELQLQRDVTKDWKVPGLKMVSDFGTLDLQSSYGQEGIQATGKGKLDLPVLLTQLPHLLKVQEDLRLESGTTTVTVALNEEPGAMHIIADAVIENLAGRQDHQSFTWDTPLTLQFDGRLADKEPEIDKLALKASFLDIQGKGNLKHFTLNGSADLKQATQQLGKIIQLGWKAGGQLEMQVETEKDENNRYAVSAQLDIADCRLDLVEGSRTVLPSHPLHFSGKLNTPEKFPAAKADAADLTFDLSSWAGEFKGSVEGIYREDGQIMARYQLSADLVLARVTELLHQFELAEEETSLAGSMTLDTSGYTEKDRIVVSKIDSRVKDFILYRQGKIFRESELHLFTTAPTAEQEAGNAVRPLATADSRAAFFAAGGGYNLIDTTNHRLVLRNLNLKSGFADIRAKRLFLEDWQQKPAPAIKELQVNGTADLQKLTILLQQLEALPAAQKFGGNAAFDLDLTERKEDIKIAGKKNRGNSGTVKLDLDQFTYSKIEEKGKGTSGRGKEELLLERQKVVFRSHLHGDLIAGDVQFTTFDIESAPLSMQADGELQLSGKNRHFSLQGQATPDLASIVAILNGMYALGIDMKGRKKEKFTLYYPLSPEEQNAKIDLRFATSVYADSFSKSGIDIRDMSIDTDMKDGIMAAALEGILNEGLLQVAPRIDYTKNPPLLTLTEPQQILTDVHLEQYLTDGILKVVHPVFGALATPAGIINARLDRFSLPLGGKGLKQIDFNLTLDLTRVALQPKGVLSSILEAAGYADSALTMKEKTMTCDGVQGKITCSPVKVTVADSEIVISGSAGIDGSLHYVVEVPVTSRLVGKKGYELLKGATLKVPVRGTRDNPVYSRKALMEAASDLLRQAAGQATKNILQDQVDKVAPELDKVVPGLLDGLFGK
ncbi:MAG: hypothetical protein ACL93V_13635 [Candidatus Electrothrix sp. YB6]